LSYKEKEKLFNTIQELKENNITIIYISHILEDIFAICGRVSVLRDGNIVGVEYTNDINKNDLIKKMVGREMNQMYPALNRKRGGRIMLETRNITSSKVKDVSIQIGEGEIVGVYGLMGAGRTEFLRAIYGIDTLIRGEVYIKSKRIKKPSPIENIRNGVAFVTEDRHLEGLLLQKSIAENLPLVVLPKISGWAGIINRKKETELIEKAITDLMIKFSDYRIQTADNLSGGNQQKVVFGKWVMNRPDIFLLDEPTRGVDVGAKFEIYSIIVDMAKQGAAVLFVSSEMEELIGLCDRILVMKDGAITGQVNRDEYSQETVIKLAL
jgi:ribose transport system ATP-binding protein